MKRLILELSLKPFYDLSDQGIRSVICKILQQWQPLSSEFSEVAFLLWAADGSEILDYKGKFEDEFEWAKWVGNANKPDATGVDPNERLHSHRWPYRENSVRFTYERLRFLVATLKEATSTQLGTAAEVGATFDPGPEFAPSSFKYIRHPEIAVGETMGASQWVHCAAVLHGDDAEYAGFPSGIPEGTTLGTFLGRQSQHFLTDMGFDYIWFSNGFGYSLSSWSVTGEVFDGKKFDTTRMEEVRPRILRFWEDFRKECPLFPIETRGSNLSTAMDISSDASPVREIYQGGFNLKAPPNSPWAAINGDYGLEIVGWLSHIAELPDDNGFPFRYYIHDPWWINSPWLDRYGREPHDIYLPLAVARLNEQGGVDRPDSVALLTVDDSYGRLPDVVPLEVIPHLKRALGDYSDAPGLVTWIYPFDEYHDWAEQEESRVNEVFFGDWFMRAAVNQGFPLNSVISSKNFVQLPADKRLFADTILVAPAPDAGSALADALLEQLAQGGQVLLYGSIRQTDERILQQLNLEIAEGIAGDLQWQSSLLADEVKHGDFPVVLHYRELLSGGGVEAVLRDKQHDSVVMAHVSNETESRVFAAFDENVQGGRLGWVRGAFCETVLSTLGLPERDDPTKLFTAERMLRWALQKFDCLIQFEKPSLTALDPVILAARCRNAWYFSGFTPSTNTRLRWRMPDGVPIPVGCDVLFDNGIGIMALQRAWHRECRVFVEQQAEGEVICREQHSGEVGVSRRLFVSGLKNARLVFFADPNAQIPVRFQMNNAYPGKGTAVEARQIKPGKYEVTGYSGELLISW